MHCVPGFECPGAARVAVAEPMPLGARAQRLRNRQEAVMYLLAAARADSASQREALRRRAAELILPAGSPWGSPSFATDFIS